MKAEKGIELVSSDGIMDEEEEEENEDEDEENLSEIGDVGLLEHLDALNLYTVWASQNEEDNISASDGDWEDIE